MKVLLLMFTQRGRGHAEPIGAVEALRAGGTETRRDATKG
jgi:hypothetical protein